MNCETDLIKVYLQVRGTVQGVGFRPFVFRLATELKLNGWVRNAGGMVEIELRGVRAQVDSFLERLQTEAPPVSRITSVEKTNEQIEKLELTGFLIEESEQKFGTAEVSPDIATCSDCLGELFDKHDRRFRYPFLNCTNCGPRFTVIRKLPYDRDKTTMSCFPMCRECLSEYENPFNRRFHAQPNACPECGPTVCFVESANDKIKFHAENNESAIADAVRNLREGKIVAIKGLGGFHLACDATNNGAVTELRKRKQREAKPFAVMMTDLEMVQEFCVITNQEEQLLCSLFRPIVLLLKRDLPNLLAGSIAPQNPFLGIMLPYTPLQHVLMRDYGKPLVMTSANLSEEPIVSGNREAMAKLGTICDGFLLHNRDISSRYDDTVTRVMNGRESIVRRARGYAPKPIDLPFQAKKPVLAVGGHLKNTFCLVQDNLAYVSQHIGDLDRFETLKNFRATLETYLSLFRTKPEIIACDLHPDYGSTRLVEDWLSSQESVPFDISGISHVARIQHHFAHVVSCMVENKLRGSVIGVSFDGIGYGADGKLWGGEILKCSYSGYERLARLRNVRMPGGAQSIKEPWRMALSHMHHVEGRTATKRMIEERITQLAGHQKVSQVGKLIQSDSGPETSSCGRLFDAVASMLGICDLALYEGHAAVALEAEAMKSIATPSSFKASSSITTEGIIELETESIIDGVLLSLEKRIDVSEIAARFHETIAEWICTTCLQIRTKYELGSVCLSGGVFQNALLTNRVSTMLQNEGFEVFHNSLVPANDGGISLGQAVAALAKFDLLQNI